MWMASLLLVDGNIVVLLKISSSLVILGGAKMLSEAPNIGMSCVAL